MATEFPDGNPDAFEEGTQIPVVQQILFQEGSATKKKKLIAPRPLYPGVLGFRQNVINLERRGWPVTPGGAAK